MNKANIKPSILKLIEDHNVLPEAIKDDYYSQLEEAEKFKTVRVYQLTPFHWMSLVRAKFIIVEQIPDTLQVDVFIPCINKVTVWSKVPLPNDHFAIISSCMDIDEERFWNYMVQARGTDQSLVSGIIQYGFGFECDQFLEEAALLIYG